jgi:two-component system sensor kinase FixL
MSSSTPLTGAAHNELASQLLQAMPEAVFLVDPESLSILDTNSAAERLTDRSRRDLIGGVLSEIFCTSDGTDLTLIVRVSADASADQPPQLVQLRSADDQSLPLVVTGSVLAADGQSIGMVIVRDDTELVRLKTIEAEHQVSLAKQEEVFLALEGFAWECESTTGVFTYVSPRVEDIFGYPASDWLDNPEFFPSVIHPEDRDSILSFCKQETNTGADHTMIYRMITADGSIKWIRDIVYLARNDAGVVTHLRGLILDITDERHLRDQLQQSEKRFRRLFDHSPDAIFVESPDGVVLDANLAACKLHKVSLNELIGQDVLSLIPPEDRPAATNRSDFLVTGELSEFESRSLQSDGNIVPIGVRLSPITYDGSPAVLLHVRDITQQKDKEEQKREHERQLAHVSRLTMMGQLVAGIAHEIRQPLWSLSTFADVCVESLSKPDFAKRLPQIRDVASKVVSEARRVNAITTRMFAFARKGTPERTVSNIHEIVNDAVELTAGRARSSRIKTTVDVEPDVPAVICDRVLIEQTFANLLNNAYAVLAVHPSDLREVKIDIHVDPEDRDYITAAVRDNGPGLPDGILPEQLFEGFFTTGQSGLGIGLALSRSFVEDHGGAIRAEQLLDGGMEFVFTLRVDGGKDADADRSATGQANRFCHR